MTNLVNLILNVMKFYPLLFLSFIAITACELKSSIQDSTDTSSTTFSATYIPAAFDDPERVEKVKNLAPKIETLFKATAEKNHFPGMVYGIVMDGKLIWSGGVGVINLETKVPVSNHSLFKIASMTKSFTAMAIMKLQEEGKIRLSDEAALYVPEMGELTYLAKDAAPITIENLLTMTAGFPEDNPWGDRQLEDSPEELLALLSEGLSFSNIPSWQFEYSNTGYAILGQIISNVSGMPYQQYLTENIFRPLGMNSTHWEYEGLSADQLALGYRWEDEQWKPEPMLHDGAFGAMGGLITSLEDFSKYVAFHLSAYPPRNADESGPVKRSSLRAMHKPKEPNLFADARDGNGNPCPIISAYGFGLGWRKDCTGQVRVSHSGGLPGFGSEYRFYPDFGLGIISFANRTYAGTGGINNQVANLVFEEAGLQPRTLPASEILITRKQQVEQWLRNWSPELEQEVFAENFFLDYSRENRIEQYKAVLDVIGKIDSVGEISPLNQLRGSFVVAGEKGKANVFFTLTPERVPKVQDLSVWVAE